MYFENLSVTVVAMLLLTNDTHDSDFRAITDDTRPITHDPRTITHDTRIITHDARTITHDKRTITNLLNFYNARTLTIKHAKERFYTILHHLTRKIKILFKDKNKGNVQLSIL